MIVPELERALRVDSLLVHTVIFAIIRCIRIKHARLLKATNTQRTNIT